MKFPKKSAPMLSSDELRRILGALLLGADHALTVREIRRVLESVETDRRAESGEGPAVSDEELLAAAEKGASAPDAEADAEAAKFDALPEDETVRGLTGIDGKTIRAELEELGRRFGSLGLGISLGEIDGTYRLQTEADCGPWVRKMLRKDRPQRMSKPMIETLAVIAYRQPVTRSGIESIRGVGVGHVLKALAEMRLVKIVGRSDLPGRPYLFGTTQEFLDHFGLKDLSELDKMQPDIERVRAEDGGTVKFSFKGSATDEGADQPELPLG